MDRKKRERLENSGWKVGTVQEFLGLSDEEQHLIDMKIGLGRRLKERRQDRDMTQQQLARELGSSQSRVAKMETADASVSVELLIRSLLRMGVDRREVGRIVGSGGKAVPVSSRARRASVGK